MYDFFTNYCRLDDIRFRHILNIKKYDIMLLNDFYKKYKEERIRDKIPYFYINDDEICIGYVIQTIDFEITIPVIGMTSLRQKYNLKNQLEEYLPRFKKRHRTNIYLFLIQNCILPIEMIHKIMYFY